VLDVWALISRGEIEAGGKGYEERAKNPIKVTRKVSVGKIRGRSSHEPWESSRFPLYRKVRWTKGGGMLSLRVIRERGGESHVM